MEIHELLREIREASKKESGKKVTQEDCAEYLDISTRQYIKYETGEANINAVNFFKVCALCRIYKITELVEKLNFFMTRETVTKGHSKAKSVSKKTM